MSRIKCTACKCGNCIIEFVYIVLVALQVQHVTTATLVWMFSRHDLDKTIKPVVTVLLLLTAYKGFWLEGLLDLLTLNAWFTLILKTLVSMFIGLASLYYYISLAQQIGL